MPQVISRRVWLGRSLGTAGMLGVATLPRAARSAPHADAAELTAKAVDFLKPRQADDGSWSADRREPGITGLIVAALLRSKRVTSDEPVVTRALGYLEKYLGPAGGFNEEGRSVYTTSVALMAFHEANRGGRYDALVKKGQDFLKGKQYDESEGKDRSDVYYGGAGYGDARSRPDMSNTSFMIEALRDSGLPADDPAFKKALIFVSRCQNLKSEFNDQPFAEKVNDGGFIYSPTGGGQSPAGKAEEGGPRSYAGMTYAGLKSMIHAGLNRDDPRVKAALGYIARNYTLEENPGMGQRGLFYYYQTFAKAMSLLGEPKFKDAEGGEHDWRADLVAALAKRQDANGSWVNRSDQFMEGDPNLVTGFALLALAYARA